jgi:hypothetical protein
LFHRERLHNNYLVLLEKLMDYSELHRDYDAGLAYGERLLNRDKVRERIYVRMMRLQYLAGDRAGAIRWFHRCEAVLQEELGIRPSRRTVEVYERIRVEQFDAVPPHTGAPILGEAETVPGLRELKSQLLTQLERDIVRRGPQPIIPLAPHESSANEKLLSWLIHFWPGDSITLRDVRAFGPNCARDLVDAVRLTQTLTEYGWLTPAPARRRDMRKWTIVREPNRGPTQV